MNLFKYVDKYIASGCEDQRDTCGVFIKFPPEKTVVCVERSDWGTLYEKTIISYLDEKNSFREFTLFCSRKTHKYIVELFSKK